MINNNNGRANAYGINPASVLNRIMSGLLDFILTVVLATGFFSLISRVLNYDDISNQLMGKYVEYGVYIEDDNGGYQYNGHTYSIVVDTTTYNEVKERFNNDAVAVNLEYKSETCAFASISTGCLLSLIVIDFVLPLLFKNGRTIGGIMMKVGLISKKGIKISNVQLFARCIIGRYIIETIIPIILWALYGVVGVFVFCIGLVFIITLSPNHQLPHNIVSNILTCDQNLQYYAISKEDLKEHLNSDK